MAHSKRNSTSAFFTQSERAELRSTWGSRSTRLTRESFLPFGSCNLCLQLARDPVSCSDQGHLFCRECAVTNLLAQNKEIKRLKKEAERRKTEVDTQKILQESEKKARELEEFEHLQAGLQSTSEHTRKRKAKPTDRDDDRRVKRPNNDSSSFWIPGQTAGEEEKEAKAIKSHSSCPVVNKNKAHDFSLKSMVAVKFKKAESKDPSAQQGSICPSCDKVLSNTTKGVLAKPCGHVVCKTCSERFQIPDSAAGEQPTARCYVCQADLTPDEGISEKDKHKISRGLVELRSDGTGFAGGGNNIVKREGLAFQVG